MMSHILLLGRLTDKCGFGEHYLTQPVMCGGWRGINDLALCLWTAIWVGISSRLNKC